MKDKFDIVLLPTTNKSNLILFKSGILFYNSSELKEDNLGFERKHLYILSEEKIKEDDWFVNELNQVWQHNGQVQPSLKSKKIIATTDSLKIECQGCRFHKNNSSVIYSCCCQILSQISRRKIDYYNLNYTKGLVFNKVTLQFENKHIEYMNDMYSVSSERNQQIKIYPDNTIAIKQFYATNN